MPEKQTSRTSIRYKLMIAFLLQSSLLGIFICYSTRKILKSALMSRDLPEDLVAKILYNFTTVITSLTLLGIIIVLLVSFLFSNSIARGLKALMQGIHEIKDHNLKHKIDIESNDEIGELAESFNMMARQLSEREEALRESAEELKKANLDLTAHREHLQELVEAKTKEVLNELDKHKRLENDIRQILNASSDAIRVIDLDFNVVYASESLIKLKGLEGKDLIGKKCYKIDSEKECFTEECPLKRILKKQKIFEQEKVITSQEGVEKPYLLRFAPYTDAEGNLAGVVKSYKDITEEKQVRKIAEENAQQQGRIEMANNMLHDIGNALTGISTQALRPQLEKDWSELKSLRQLNNLFESTEADLRNIFGDDKGRALINLIKVLISSLEKRKSASSEFYQKISNAVRHMSSVLDLQRHYMREKAVALTSDINLRTLLEDSITMLASSIEKRNIKIKINLDDNNPVISGDQTRLIRVFLNIIKNIYEAFDEIDSTENRRLDITVTTDRKDKKAKIVFIDNASGFTRETGEKLFERGFTTKTRGTGIGLHECRAIVESHNGTITIESKGKNQGTTTIITLPLLVSGQR